MVEPEIQASEETGKYSLFNDRRKRQYIDKKQQLRFALTIGLYSFLFSVFFLALTISPPFSELLLGGDKQMMQFYRSLVLQFVGFSITHWWIALFALAFISFSSLIFSHKIFGPVRRYEQVLREKRENPTKAVQIRLRGGDYFHEFSQQLEQVLNETHVGAGDSVEDQSHSGEGTVLETPVQLPSH